MRAALSGLSLLVIWIILALTIWRGVTKPRRPRSGVIKGTARHMYLVTDRDALVLYDPEETR